MHVKKSALQIALLGFNKRIELHLLLASTLRLASASGPTRLRLGTRAIDSHATHNLIARSKA